jgi:hypothetical protein
MSPHPRFCTLLVVVLSFVAGWAIAAPIEFQEVSLLVRAGQSETSIVQDVSQRKLLRPLTPQQESTLHTQGAPDSLMQSLRNSKVILTPQDAEAFEQERAARAKLSATGRTAHPTEQSELPEDLRILDVAVGHPINLSQWGGPDYEFAFNEPTRLDEGRADAVLINNAGSFTHVATYLGAGRPDDNTTIFDRRNYVSIMDHSLVRGLHIDRLNPVWRKGVPYTLYPVYAAGGVSLYYIGSSRDSVKLAISTAGR